MMKRKLKRVSWIETSLEDLRRFPELAQDRLGRQLHRVQLGLEPFDYKSMPIIGAGVYELRSHASGEHRVVYVARHQEAVYVLHAFEKKTQKTPQRELALARRRFSALQRARENG
jgi:phage-related protein